MSYHGNDSQTAAACKTRHWLFRYRSFLLDPGTLFTLATFSKADERKKNQTACGHPTLKDGVYFGPHASRPVFWNPEIVKSSLLGSP